MARQKMNKEIFVEKSVKIHGYKYDYSGTEFISVYDRLNILCIDHGLFSQLARNHLTGSGCPKCAIAKISNELSSSKEDILNRFKIKHGDRYDYSLVEYKNSSTKIKIICRDHGVFEQLPQNHILGKGCELCSIEYRASKRRYTINKFVDLAKTIHGNRYDYSLVKYINNSSPISIICRVHGEFSQTPNAHMAGHGCRSCGNISALRLRCRGRGFTSYSRSDYKRISDLSHNGLSKFYVVKFKSDTESFFKIGISVNGVKNRFSNGKPYKIDSFIEFTMEALAAWDIEKYYLRTLREIKYDPKEKFGGSTECFWYVPSCVYDKAKIKSKSISGRGDLYDSYALE